MSTSQNTVVIGEDKPELSELSAELMRPSSLRVNETYTGAPTVTLIGEGPPVWSSWTS